MSDVVYVTGDLYWARTQAPETDPWGNTGWKIAVYPDKESLTVVMDMQASGIKNILKKDDRGYYINFKRPSVDKKGKTYAPPEVVDAEGKPVTDLIGNGSKGVVKLSLRTFALKTGGKGAAAILDKIKVTELVPYETSGKKSEASDEDF